MSTTTEHEFMTIAEAAALVRVSPSTIRRWIASGKLHPIRPGARTVRIARAELTHVPFEARPTRYWMRMSDGIVHTGPLPRVMSEEDRQRLQGAIEESRRLREEQRENYGIADKEGWEILNELRDERTRQLMGDD